ncbi:SUMO ligase siz1 [Acarospora aff. strigata]|nr:SUMO ligase siz1 [Acarospora aff. strigata]
MASSEQPLDPHVVVARVKTLINAQLKSVLKGEGLPVSGVKSAMQGRIIAHLESYARTGNIEGFNRVKNLVYNPDGASTPTTPRSGYSGPIKTSTPATYSTAHGLGRSIGSVPVGMPPHPYAPVHLVFKDSPFYTILEPLTPIIECRERDTTRDSVDCKLVFSPAVADKLQRDPKLRVMIYCAADTALSPYVKADIAFPHQVEIKVNLDDIKANLRGLKNKPGSTRPADITNLVRKRANYENSVVMTYALTHKKFFVVVNLVRQHSVEELVAKLRSGKSISKEQVICEMISKAQDADIVATSTVMSLKCPLSTLRIQMPCRSTICTHNQCFDASSFLQLQEQAPTWTCPVCNKIIVFEALEVDQYVDDILMSTGVSVEQVTIEPNGKWTVNSKSECSPRRNGASSSTDEDEDLVEIKDARVTSLKEEAPYTPLVMSRTPPSSSREPSIASGSIRSTTGKRPIGQVIDLTFSDDDDDEPPRAAKRHTSYGGVNGATGAASKCTATAAAARLSGGSPRLFKNSSLSDFDSPYIHRNF